MLNLSVSAREALKEHRISFTGDETWLKLSSMYLTERAQHLHAQTRPVCSNVKSVLTLSFDIHRFVLYIFVPQGQTETTLTTLICYDVCVKMCYASDLIIGILGDCLLHCDNTAFLCSVDLVLYGLFIFPKLKMVLRDRRFNDMTINQNYGVYSMKALNQSTFVGLVT